ncbi:MAG: sensor domain-containing diguanylate cyclase, partial [Proteobacteria bacterium]|nr:sensor domain-containing diguanylate cyclase [Pseudomonadota bacterium]
VDLIADLLEVPVVLIIKKLEQHIEVFTSNNCQDNPYVLGPKEPGTGLYCEHVIETGEPLLVANACMSKRWESSPDVKLGMIAYLGYPVCWPTGETFGTLCVLDREETQFTDKQSRILSLFAEMVEYSLRFLYEQWRREQLETDIETLEEKERKYRELSLTDSLTGTANRRAFYQQSQNEFKRSVRESQVLSVLLIDIDLFKKINDQWGHTWGDKVLQDVSNIIENSLRAYDVIGRIGGDEFAATLPNTNMNQAFDLAERLRENIVSQSTQFNEHNIEYSISTGIASLKQHQNFNSLIEDADRALYLAKKQGRNQSIIFES